MKYGRREFLVATGAAAALSACDVRPYLFQPPPPRDAGPFLAPAAAEVDLSAHLLARLTYGPRPGD